MAAYGAWYRVYMGILSGVVRSRAGVPLQEKPDSNGTQVGV